MLNWLDKQILNWFWFCFTIPKWDFRLLQICYAICCIQLCWWANHKSNPILGASLISLLCYSMELYQRNSSHKSCENNFPISISCFYLSNIFHCSLICKTILVIWEWLYDTLTSHASSIHYYVVTMNPLDPLWTTERATPT